MFDLGRIDQNKALFYNKFTEEQEESYVKLNLQHVITIIIISVDDGAVQMVWLMCITQGKTT